LYGSFILSGQQTELDAFGRSRSQLLQMLTTDAQMCSYTTLDVSRYFGLQGNVQRQQSAVIPLLPRTDMRKGYDVLRRGDDSSMPIVADIQGELHIARGLDDMSHVTPCTVSPSINQRW
jgi:hypothetical protein